MTKDLVKNRITAKKTKNETIIKKIGEFVDNIPRETKELINRYVSRDIKAYLIKGLTAFREYKHYGVLIYVNEAE